MPARLLSPVRAVRRLGRGRLSARLLPLTQAAGRLGRSRAAGAGTLVVTVAMLGVFTGASHRVTRPPPSKPAPQVQATAVETLPVASTAAPPERASKRPADRPRRGGRAHYRRTARARAPVTTVAAFVPLYYEAERVYGVNWRLIAAIHRQETAFSAAPSTYHGLNAFGCCAGPMQFNLTNGPVSTWELYRNAFRTGRRPARYPHRTRSHPSVYDDFDAIMAAGALLSDSGAGALLDGGAWTAAYAYYGHDLYGVTYASQVVARAEGWQRNGFCPNCEPAASLVAEFDALYGESVRRDLLAAQDKGKKRKRRKKPDADDRRRDRLKAIERAEKRARLRLLRPGAGSDPAATGAPPTPPGDPRRPTKPSPPPRPTPPPAAAPPPASEPTPPEGACSPLQKLLGCGRAPPPRPPPG